MILIHRMTWDDDGAGPMSDDWNKGRGQGYGYGTGGGNGYSLSGGNHEGDSKCMTFEEYTTPPTNPRTF